MKFDPNEDLEVQRRALEEWKIELSTSLHDLKNKAIAARNEFLGINYRKKVLLELCDQMKEDSAERQMLSKQLDVLIKDADVKLKQSFVLQKQLEAETSSYELLKKAIDSHLSVFEIVDDNDADYTSVMR
ncbi:hypothetical protein [Paenibacillus sp. S25]|uniref:hypothetical protein n=1 Tax=Paenibacillus sp. S25 TaxID=2823905 RepID=UPI001C646559|nr:hypothetical protein [Paenibacillus sp. S25]QYK62599.1 hypothetical protein KAI37_02929 [Paenibacillus sp. S25]